MSNTTAMNLTLTKDFVLDNVSPQVVNANALLPTNGDPVSTPLLNLKVVYRVNIPNTNASFIVTNDVLKTIDVSVDELIAKAKENLQKEEFTCMTMFEQMCALYHMTAEEFITTTGITPPENDSLVLTSSNAPSYGARVLLRPDMLAIAAEKANNDLYILPSSVHEILALSVDQVELKNLKAMVMQVNATEVQPEDWLSDSVYKYTRSTGAISIALA